MFKVGDRVRCVDDFDAHPFLKKGSTYEVYEVQGYSAHDNMCVVVKGHKGGWFVRRFELLGEAPVLPEPVLPTDSEERKQIPIFSGVLNYFPLAIAAVARLSKRGNDKHNPGQTLHWSRDKSQDHEDCIARHLIDVDTLDPKSGEYEDAVALAWRALAKLQLLEEKRLNKPTSRGSK